MDGAQIDVLVTELEEAAAIIGRGCERVRNLGLRRILGHLERTRSSLLGGIESLTWEEAKASRRAKGTPATTTK